MEVTNIVSKSVIGVRKGNVFGNCGLVSAVTRIDEEQQEPRISNQKAMKKVTVGLLRPIIY